MSPEITSSKNNVDKNYFSKNYIDKNHIKHHKDHKVLACKVYLLDSLLFRLLFRTSARKEGSELKKKCIFFMII